MSKNNMKKSNRSLSFGVNSIFLTVVVLGIIGVINFVAQQYPKKFDMTKNKIHTFSDQSVKVMKGLKSELKATLFGDFGSREKFRPLIDNYKKLNPQFKFELVDPNKEPTRAKTAGIKKMDTLMLEYQGKIAKIEDISEEKVTNEVIKLTKDVKQLVCSIVGHGEKSIHDQGAEGFASLKKGLEDQVYEIKEFQLSQEAKVPADCTAVLVLGPNKAFFPNEMKALEDYLSASGRMVIAIGASIEKSDQTNEIRAFLKTWGVEVKGGLVVDPVSRKLGVDASVPLITQFNPDVPIAKDFSGQQCFLPFTRPLEPISPAPTGLKVDWLAKTMPNAWGEQDLASITKGQVTFNQGADITGPINAAITVTGKKDAKATRDSRLVVFGSSGFVNNQYSRFGSNLDLGLNSISWVVEDESLISIRAKEDEIGKVELSQNQGLIIFWISVIIVPLVIAILGIVIWVRRKKL